MKLYFLPHLYSSRSPNFQFLWGWNPISKDIKIVLPFELSIPLRMKPFRMERTDEGELLPTFNSFEDETRLQVFLIRTRPKFIFQFLWGWNLTAQRYSLKRMETFNSFEDETSEGIHETICPLHYLFQFLWGWNMLCPHHFLPVDMNFQFLWGWNYNVSTDIWKSIWTFNSFEDETRTIRSHSLYLRHSYLSIPLRMKLYTILQHLTGNYTFNSFEDETVYKCKEDGVVLWELSIPLRMKLCSLSASVAISLSPFNSFEDETFRMQRRCGCESHFQFLWGWNRLETIPKFFSISLSIPLRMKQSISECILKKLLSFNSFEDETQKSQRSPEK